MTGELRLLRANFRNTIRLSVYRSIRNHVQTSDFRAGYPAVTPPRSQMWHRQLHAVRGMVTSRIAEWFDAQTRPGWPD
jgi:hypothetical protein